ncbi:hypothetical protein SISNIDRAFT_482140 [Sistotremastrum niveocremeum HHB9708]|uniref:Uncharacterized protein n=1 Tax=Sistotremastrum niveocremeum HHB9708 TaxID=1314777 RepID=A0A164YT55_9AGAM|nr:hypothetical protein SISNIDRAFT_482140 [Sistotremastrum niveocremeum HHB9708]
MNALFFLFALQILTTSAQLPYSYSSDSVTCVPFGPCEPCPADALHQPFCQPFGNRRLAHCSSPSTPSNSSNIPPNDGSIDDDVILPPSEGKVEGKGKTPTWMTCGRVVEQERRDFFEFVMCNVILAGLAITLVITRSKALASNRTRRLAARIHVRRRSTSGWGT